MSEDRVSPPSVDAANVALRLVEDLIPPKGCEIKYRYMGLEGWEKAAVVTGVEVGSKDSDGKIFAIAVSLGPDNFVFPQDIQAIISIPHDCPPLCEWPTEKELVQCCREEGL